MPVIAELDHDECERAPVQRDRRYDGRGRCRGRQWKHDQTRSLLFFNLITGYVVSMRNVACQPVTRRLATVPALPARDSAVLASLTGFAHDGAWRHAADPQWSTRSRRRRRSG